MKKVIKILFPFFKKDRHKFLMAKWWFRLLIVFYVIGFFMCLGLIFNNLAHGSWKGCYERSYLYSTGGDSFLDSPKTDYTALESHLEFCRNLWKQDFAPFILLTVALTFAIHYIVQLVFFKVIINFVVLGNKNK